jgi:elongation factor Ts
MSITAQQVKELRERTGLGMMECKSALIEAKGDMDAAIEWLRKKAGAKVEKRAGRIATDGAIGLYVSSDGRLAALAEVNSETDFVAKGDDFLAFANAVAAVVARRAPADPEALYALSLKDSGETVAQAREGLVMKLGENIGVRRFARYQADDARIGVYVHGRRIGVLVEVEGGDEQLARDLAMHIAASCPEYVTRADVPAAVVEKEKALLVEEARASGKPMGIVEKMVMGRLNKHLNEITLLGQPFVRDPDTAVEKLLKAKGAKVRRFVRFEVGEGVEKREADFAAEVMAQAKGGG